MPRYLLSDLEYGEDEERAVLEVLRSRWLSVGPRSEAFESEFAAFLGARHAVHVASCTAALHLALLACDIGPGDEVLVPSYTFVASANPILYVGATPVFVDIVGGGDLNMSPADAAAKITSRSKAMIVVHVAGFPADMQSLLTIAERHGLAVIEDAAHALGAMYTARGVRYPVGRLGHAACFSFFANKNLPTGEGGMLVTEDAAIATRVRQARSHGMTKTSWDKASGRATDYDVQRLGFNYRSTELAAALGRIQLRKLPANNDRRRELAERYRRNLAGCDGIEPAFGDRFADAAHHLFAVLLRDPTTRAGFRERLAAEGIQTSIHYPPVHHFTQYRRPGREHEPLPLTADAAEREVTLPLHPLLTLDDVDIICSHVASVGGRRGRRAPPETAG
ncbi:MAG TPA: DegT/DnrJ/EryC1/StrS family aminotransferase [Gammaproteobacteria bacterium]